MLGNKFFATFHVLLTVTTAFVTFKMDSVLVVNLDGRDKPEVQVRYYFTVQYSKALYKNGQ